MALIINELDLPVAQRMELFGERYYYTDSPYARVPSVTTVLKAAMGPDLTDWYARRAVRCALDMVQENPLPLSQPELMQARKDITVWASEDADRQRMNHAIVGDIFHGFMWTASVDDPRVVEALPAEFRKMVDRLIYNWSQMLQMWSIYPVLAELPVVNSFHGYGGTLDALVEDEYGRRILLEVKTGREVRLEHALQASAYGAALRRLGVEFSDVAVLRVDKYRDNVFEYRRVNEAKAFPSFVSALAVYNTNETIWEYENV